jgi:RNA polymerase sigma-70 factor (ECF subfamily)
MSDADDDTELEARARGGDSAALAAFIERRRPQLTAYVERRLGPALRRKVEPADVVQETALSALRGAANTDLTDRELFGWLCHLAEERIIDANRHFTAAKRDSGREVSMHGAGSSGGSSAAGLEEWLAASLTTPTQAATRNERQQRLEVALAALPAEGREVLRLRYGEGLPTKEIAGRIGKTDGAVRVMLSRAVQRLRELLDEGGATATH